MISISYQRGSYNLFSPFLPPLGLLSHCSVLLVAFKSTCIRRVFVLGLWFPPICTRVMAHVQALHHLSFLRNLMYFGAVYIYSVEKILIRFSNSKFCSSIINNDE